MMNWFKRTGEKAPPSPKPQKLAEVQMRLTVFVLPVICISLGASVSLVDVIWAHWKSGGLNERSTELKLNLKDALLSGSGGPAVLIITGFAVFWVAIRHWQATVVYPSSSSDSPNDNDPQFIPVNATESRSRQEALSATTADDNETEMGAEVCQNPVATKAN